VVQAPVNITVVNIPSDFESVTINDDAYYYFGGTFYVKSDSGYTVVKAPDGAVVSKIPDGAEEIELEDKKYVVYNDVYYQPLVQDGVNVYQVVNMIPIE
jgi:hypothetical protein